MEQGCHDSGYSLRGTKGLLKRRECIRTDEGCSPLSSLNRSFIHSCRVQADVEFIQNWMNELIELSTVRSYRLKEDRGLSIWKASAGSETKLP
jgi:hypothetical protein